MKVNIELDQASLQRLQQKCRPDLYAAALHDVMKKAATMGEPVMEKAIQGGTEMAMQSIGAVAYRDEARVYSVIPFARGMSIEEGRRPGDAPGLVATARWLTGRRYMTARRLDELPRDVVNDARAAQKAIRASGARGKQYLKQTREFLRGQLPAFMNDMARRIEQKWRAN